PSRRRAAYMPKSPAGNSSLCQPNRLAATLALPATSASPSIVMASRNQRVIEEGAFRAARAPAGRQRPHQRRHHPHARPARTDRLYPTTVARRRPAIQPGGSEADEFSALPRSTCRTVTGIRAGSPARESVAVADGRAASLVAENE